MKTSMGIEVGTLHEDGRVTDPQELEWKKFFLDNLIAGPFSNGEFDYFLVIHVEDASEWGDGATGLSADLKIISPQQAGEENVEKACGCCGIEEEELTEEMKAMALAEYGIFAMVWQEWDKQAEDETALIKKAKTEAKAVNMLFGFYMDKQQNQIGATGWDTIAGNLWPKQGGKDHE